MGLCGKDKSAFWNNFRDDLIREFSSTAYADEIVRPEDVRKRIEEEIKIRQKYTDYLEGKGEFPKFEKGEVLAYSLFGSVRYTEEGKKLPEWQKRYDVTPHEKKHGLQQWKILFDLLTIKIKTSEDLQRRRAEGEVEAYTVSVKSMQEYLKTLEKQGIK